MIHDGASREEAISQVWLVDKQGLLIDDMADLRNYQQPYARPAAEIKAWERHHSRLAHDHQARQADDPARHLHRPRSIHQADHRRDVCRCRPTDHPADLQSDFQDRGDALRCHPLERRQGAGRRRHPGSTPFPTRAVDYQIGQANNALLYPGLALGTIVSRAKHVTPNMLVAAGRRGRRPGRPHRTRGAAAPAGRAPAGLVHHRRRRGGPGRHR